jgi:hypothetical protein
MDGNSAGRRYKRWHCPYGHRTLAPQHLSSDLFVKQDWQQDSSNSGQIGRQDSKQHRKRAENSIDEEKKTWTTILRSGILGISRTAREQAGTDRPPSRFQPPGYRPPALTTTLRRPQQEPSSNLRPASRRTQTRRRAFDRADGQEAGIQRVKRRRYEWPRGGDTNSQEVDIQMIKTQRRAQPQRQG